MYCTDTVKSQVVVVVVGFCLGGWFSGVVDCAMYPLLFYSAATAFASGKALNDDAIGDDDDALADTWSCIGTWSCLSTYLIKLGITLAFTIPNLFHVRFLGHGLGVLCVLVCLPLLFMCIMALPHISPSRWFEGPAAVNASFGASDCAKLVSLLFWNFNGFSQISTFAGEVDKPSTTYPLALLGGVVITALSYVAPLGAAIGFDGGAVLPWAKWEGGSLAVIAQGIGGQWLGLAVVLSALVGNWGLYSSELLEDSTQLQGLAELGMAPRCLARRHPRWMTPIRAIALQVALTCLLAGLDFTSIITIDNFFSAGQGILEFLACLKLRVSHPDLPRPYRVPLGTWGLLALLVIPVLISAYVLVTTFLETQFSMVLNSVALLFGVVGGAIFVARNPDNGRDAGSCDVRNV